MNSAYEHVKKLVSFGARPLGSKANTRAAEYIRRTFASAGLMIEDQQFDLPKWECRATALRLDGKKLRAAANDFSQPCDVTAALVPVCTLAELESAEMIGRIALLYGNLTRGNGYGARKAFYCPERDVQVMARLEAKKPAAVITVHSKPGSLERLMRDWEFPLPSATVPAEVGLTLIKDPQKPVHLKIDSRHSPGKFRNVIGFKAGQRLERIVVLAHFDSMSNTRGAVDNASGVGILLALAGQIAGQKLETGVEFYAANGEEMGGVGDVEYLKHHEAVLPQVLAAVNIDGVGGLLGTNTLTVMGASAELQAQAAEVQKHFLGIVFADPWYASDHTALLSRGVPCIPLTSDGVQNNHSPTDNLDWVSPEKLDEVAAVVMEIIKKLQGKTPDWCREKTVERR